MSKQVQDAYIVAATRLPVGKRKGMFRTTRPDDMLAFALRSVLAQVPQIEPKLVGDVIVGCAMPEAEQGMNVARIGVLLAGLPDSVPGMTVNRFCASGVQAVAMAADRIRLGEADVMIAAGTETMSLMSQMMGNKVSLNPAVFDPDGNAAIGYGMGLTAEKVAQQWQVSRQDQDAFAVESHRRATAAIAAGHFRAEITPYMVRSHLPDFGSNTVRIVEKLCATDEGPRADSTLEALAKLRPVFATKGSVTAGNSSQMSDGAAAVVLVSEKMLKALNLAPLARFAGFAVAGVPPEIMGIGPVRAIPKALDMAGLTLDRIGLIELNEAFAVQALAVIRHANLPLERVNVSGGAVALGHPLGCTGAKLTATILREMERRNVEYGMVTMCIGGGQGAAGIFERMN